MTAVRAHCRARLRRAPFAAAVLALVLQLMFPAGFMANLPLNVFGILSNETLLAIPFFTLMGAVLEKCGLAEDMLD